MNILIQKARMIFEGKLIRADVDNGCDENKFDDPNWPS